MLKHKWIKPALGLAFGALVMRVLVRKARQVRRKPKTEMDSIFDQITDNKRVRVVGNDIRTNGGLVDHIDNPHYGNGEDIVLLTSISIACDWRKRPPTGFIEVQRRRDGSLEATVTYRCDDPRSSELLPPAWVCDFDLAPSHKPEHRAGIYAVWMEEVWLNVTRIWQKMEKKRNAVL